MNRSDRLRFNLDYTDMGRKYIRDRKKNSSKAYKRIRTRANNLGKPYKLSEAQIRVLLDPKQNPISNNLNGLFAFPTLV